MKTLYRVKYKNKSLIAKSCTDKECSTLSNKGKNKHLAPFSQGFVNLFDNDNNHIAWCGINYAENNQG